MIVALLNFQNFVISCKVKFNDVKFIMKSFSNFFIKVFKDNLLFRVSFFFIFFIIFLNDFELSFFFASFSLFLTFFIFIVIILSLFVNFIYPLLNYSTSIFYGSFLIFYVIFFSFLIILVKYDLIFYLIFVLLGRFLNITLNVPFFLSFIFIIFFSRSVQDNEKFKLSYFLQVILEFLPFIFFFMLLFSLSYIFFIFSLKIFLIYFFAIILFSPELLSFYRKTWTTQIQNSSFIWHILRFSSGGLLFLFDLSFLTITSAGVSYAGWGLLFTKLEGPLLYNNYQKGVFFQSQLKPVSRTLNDAAKLKKFSELIVHPIKALNSFDKKFMEDTNLYFVEKKILPKTLVNIKDDNGAEIIHLASAKKFDLFKDAFLTHSQKITPLENFFLLDYNKYITDLDYQQKADALIDKHPEYPIIKPSRESTQLTFVLALNGFERPFTDSEIQELIKIYLNQTSYKKNIDNVPGNLLSLHDILILPKNNPDDVISLQNKTQLFSDYPNNKIYAQPNTKGHFVSVFNKPSKNITLYEGNKKHQIIDLKQDVLKEQDFSVLLSDFKKAFPSNIDEKILKSFLKIAINNNNNK